MEAIDPQLGSGIAIVGVAGQFPGAASVREFWQMLLDGDEGITFFEHDQLDPSVAAKLRDDPNYVTARGVLNDIDQFDAGFFGISPLEASVMDPQQRLLLETSWLALEDAGIVPSATDDLIGVWMGTNWNTYLTSNVLKNASVLQRYGEFNARIANESDFPASRISYKLNLKGPSISLNTACSTSLVAVCQAVQGLMNFDCDVALAGGASISVPNRVGYLYQEGSMLSRDGHCRPFDSQASGTTFNDGVAVLTLRRLEDALAANDRIYAVIRGSGVNNDGSDKVSFTAPSVRGQEAALRYAIAQAEIDPATVGYVEAHGTATPLGDPIEVEALRAAYGDAPDAGSCLIGSVKSNVGHTVHAAGATGLIKTAFAVRTGKIPGTRHYQHSNDKLRLENTRFRVSSKTEDWPQKGVRRAGVSSFGVGGTNAHVVLEQPPGSAVTEVADREATLLFPISAKSSEALKAASANLATWLEDSNVDLRDAAYTLSLRRAAFDHRMVCVARDESELIRQLRDPRDNGVTVGKAKQTERIVFAFPGQGAQYPCMAAAAYEASASFREAVDQCLSLFEEHLETDLRTLLLGPVDHATATRALAETRNTQPALFAVGYALARHFQAQGIHPTAMIGHSIGEFAAACIAGVMPLEHAVAVVAARGRLMQACEPGAMLAVEANPEAIEGYLCEGLDLAAVNAPDACVVSGPADAIAVLEERTRADGLRATILKTSHAFHSAMMEQALPGFEAALIDIDLSAPHMAIASTATGDWLRDEEACSVDYWVQQIRRPVNFASAIATVTGEVPTCVLELGPGATLSSLGMRQCDAGHAFVPSLGQEGQGAGNPLQKTLGRLWVAGLPMDWAQHQKLDGAHLADLPPYAFQRLSFWVDPDPVTAQPRSDVETSTIAMHAPRDPSASANDREAVRDQLLQILEEASGHDLADADPDDTFSELGLDSLLLTQVSIALQEAFQVDITFRQLSESLCTLASLTEYLEENGVAETPASAGPTVDGAVATEAEGAEGGDSIALMLAQLKRMEGQLLSLGKAPQSGHGSGLSITTPIVASAEVHHRVRRTDDRPNSVRNWGDLDNKRAAALRSFIEAHAARTQASKAHTARHRAHHADPRTAAGFNPVWKEISYPLVCERSDGPNLWDLDGNQYVDLLSGFGPNLLGHGNHRIQDAILRQLNEGIEIGPQSHLAGSTAELVCKLTGMDRASFVCTGSEAVQAAIRCVRTFTRRDKIVVFKGGYHGNFDEVLVRGANGKGVLKSQPGAPGIPRRGSEDVIVLDYGTDNALEIIREISDQLAGVMVEPVQSRRPEFQPVEFLRSLRDICTESGTQLIFDEVVTGFRCHPGGAQALFGVRADVATYGKVAAGNMPIGIVAGRRDVMATFDGGDWNFGDDSGPDAPVTFFAGTFVRHPLAIAACHEMLTILEEEGPQLQERLARQTTEFAGSINAMFQEFELPLELSNFTSVMYLRNHDQSELSQLLWYYLRHNGVYMLSGFPSYLTTEHTSEVLDTVRAEFRRSLESMVEAGFFPKPRRLLRDIDKVRTVSGQPPVPGARLGRDPQGNPAWFVRDESDPTRYKQVEG